MLQTSLPKKKCAFAFEKDSFFLLILFGFKRRTYDLPLGVPASAAFRAFRVLGSWAGVGSELF